MKKFQFTLEAALRWRQLRAEQERATLEGMAAEIARIDATKLALAQEQRSIDRGIKQAASASADDLHAFDAFVRYAEERRILLEGRKVECRKRMVEQQKRLLEARREAELVEKLRVRRRAAWEREVSEELERFAAEAYLAKLTREAEREGA